MMLGKLNYQNKKVTVVGGGIAGMIAAYRFSKLGFEVTLLEASDRLGGLIETVQTPYGISEKAAHSILASPAVLRFFSELNVPLTPVQENSKARFIFRNEKPRKFPLNVWEIIQALIHLCFRSMRSMPTEGLTFESWGNTFIGKAATRYLLTPFLRGIYAAAPHELSVSAVYPDLLPEPGHSLLRHLIAKRNKKNPSQEKKQRALMMSPLRGMGEFVSTLEVALRRTPNVSIKTSSPLGSISHEILAQTNILICTPAPEASRLLNSHSPVLSKALGSISYTPMTTVTVFANSTEFETLPNGVGILNPDDQGRECLGILFSSSQFKGRTPSPDLVSLTVMLSGCDKSDSEVKDICTRELRDVLKLKGPVLHFEITRWRGAIPKYNFELEHAWKIARSTLPTGVAIFGNYTGKISLRGMIEVSEEWKQERVGNAFRV